jgi:hypothetical protein
VVETNRSKGNKEVAQTKLRRAARLIFRSNSPGVLPLVRNLLVPLDPRPEKSGVARLLTPEYTR